LIFIVPAVARLEVFIPSPYDTAGDAIPHPAVGNEKTGYTFRPGNQSESNCARGTQEALFSAALWLPALPNSRGYFIQLQVCSGSSGRFHHGR
jgi:hypothetical protein